ncbi:hypothetical protein PROFUN_08043 [Planoprotostelium fungivorum]|uniref:Uncharacterized protein n=1 Tax=Planoprotostelium fungivorum TaxID=1890364 RepID=A0A2P6NKH7_9EUKA|nr:hypothetical protein PROFUN_08043 [Planoprotostelium fungivorum]
MKADTRSRRQVKSKGLYRIHLQALRFDSFGERCVLHTSNYSIFFFLAGAARMGLMQIVDSIILAVTSAAEFRTCNKCKNKCDDSDKKCPKCGHSLFG